MKIENPFLHDPDNNELNIRKEYTELEISLSGFISRNEINLNNAPSLFLQFAGTYLSRYTENKLFLESQTKFKDKYKSIEWYINGQWYSIPNILYYTPLIEENVFFRINKLNAISLDSIDVLEANLRNYKCIVPKSPNYPEIIKDKSIDCIVYCGEHFERSKKYEDINFHYAKRFESLLGEAGFEDKGTQKKFDHFEKNSGDITINIDISFPRTFSGLVDYMNKYRFCHGCGV